MGESVCPAGGLRASNVKLNSDPWMALIQVGGYIEGFLTVASILSLRDERQLQLLRDLLSEIKKVTECKVISNDKD